VTDTILTQEEVDKLPEGTPVWVRWSGGNGPFVYRICRRNGIACVDNAYHDPLNFVGKDRCNTRVWLIQKPEVGL
jgi:hypothetical protein